MPSARSRRSRRGRSSRSSRSSRSTRSTRSSSRSCRRVGSRVVCSHTASAVQVAHARQEHTSAGPEVEKRSVLGVPAPNVHLHRGAVAGHERVLFARWVRVAPEVEVELAAVVDLARIRPACRQIAAAVTVNSVPDRRERHEPRQPHEVTATMTSAFSSLSSITDEGSQRTNDKCQQ